MDHDVSILSFIRQSRLGLETLNRKFPDVITTVAEQYILLLLIESWIERQAFSIKALFSYYNGSSTTFTGFMRRMIAAEIIVVREDPSDARVKRVSLSEARAPEIIAKMFQSADEAPELVVPPPAEDVIRRRRISPDGLSPLLGNAYRVWNTERRAHGPPVLGLKTLAAFTELVGQDHFHLVDVSAEDPANYRFSLIGAVGAQMIRLQMESLMRSGYTIGGMPSKSYRATVMEDYSETQFTGGAIGHDIVGRIDSAPLSYSRLLLPFSSDGEKIDTMLVCCDPRQFADFQAA